MTACTACGEEIVGPSVVDTEEDVEIHVGCLYDYSRSLLRANREGGQ